MTTSFQIIRVGSFFFILDSNGKKVGKTEGITEAKVLARALGAHSFETTNCR